MDEVRKALSFLRAAIFVWRAPSSDLGSRIFTYHKTSALPWVVAAVSATAPFEVLGFHFLIRHWSERASSIFTGLGIVGVLYLFALLKAFWLLPITITDETLTVRLSLLINECINMADIIDAKYITISDQEDKTVQAAWKLDQPNIRLTLSSGLRDQSHNPVTKNIEFRLDDPEEFLTSLHDWKATHHELEGNHTIECRSLSG